MAAQQRGAMLLQLLQLASSNSGRRSATFLTALLSSPTSVGLGQSVFDAFTAVVRPSSVVHPPWSLS